MGMTWTPGDEIITTFQEHPGLMLPIALLARRFGVVTRYADIGDGASGVVEALASRITSRTRVIAVSHVLWSTGAVLPLREISALARQHELMVVVDGAQSAGQVPVDLHAMGIDAYAMAGQKWLCGPEATGLLYVRRDRFADIAPTYARYGQFEPSGYFIPAAGAMRYEIGEFYSPAVAAQEAALRWLRDDVGLDWAYDRIAALGADFRRRLTSIDGVTVITPSEPMAGSGQLHCRWTLPTRGDHPALRARLHHSLRGDCAVHGLGPSLRRLVEHRGGSGGAGGGDRGSSEPGAWRGWLIRAQSWLSGGQRDTAALSR